MVDQLTIRLEGAVRSGEPQALLDLARKLKSEGMSQRAMYDAFDTFRAKHKADANETIYDAILETMDCIVGWCPLHMKLFETYLESTKPNDA